MVVKVPKACKNCGHITDDDKCPLCGGETSKDWQGYVIIVDHPRSYAVATVCPVNASRNGTGVPWSNRIVIGWAADPRSRQAVVRLCSAWARTART